MMEMRQNPENNNINEIWYFPPANFVILNFSVRNRQSYDAMFTTVSNIYELIFFIVLLVI